MASDPNPNRSGVSGQSTHKPSSKDLKNEQDGKREERLSDEGLDLKRQLGLILERIQDSNPGVQKLALESIREEIISSTSLMTFPVSIKFLRPYYDTLKAYFETMAESDLKKDLADILSVLAFTMSAEGKRESLKYRLLGSEVDIGSWGHEYVRNLVGEITEEYTGCKDVLDSPLKKLVKQIVVYHMKNNAEPEAVDLLIELDEFYLLDEHVDVTNYKRACLYLTSSSRYLLSYVEALDVAYWIYLKFEDLASAFCTALILDNEWHIKNVYISTKDQLLKKQFSFILARHRLVLKLDEEEARDEDLQDINNSVNLSERYLTLARDIGVMEPKSPEEIYKIHLTDGLTSTSSRLEPARNLADTFVNAFVNAGFCQDMLMTTPSESSGGGSSESWVFKNKEHGKTSAAASLGMIWLWDAGSGLEQMHKYLDSDDRYPYSDKSYVVAGRLIGVGIVKCGVKKFGDPLLKFLSRFIKKDDTRIQIGALLGLGIAYAGSHNTEIQDCLSPMLQDPKLPLEVLVFTAITLGLVYVGSCEQKIAKPIIFVLRNLSDKKLAEPLARLLPVALGLIYLGKKERVDDATAKISQALNEKIRTYCEVTLLSLAYAGTGNVLKIQKLLKFCGKHLKKDVTHQGPAVLGIALVAMAEELGIDMAIRSLEHLLQYGEKNVRRAVPLALGILCISNPKVNVMDTLRRLSLDRDCDLSMAAIISLGFIGAGTNNARIAKMLRHLSKHYYKEAGHLFCARIALGLVYLGKGLLTLSPYHSDQFMLSSTCWISNRVTCMSGHAFYYHGFMGEYHYMLYILALAMQPRMLMTLDENLKPLSVPVRVGQAVDLVGQVGQPKSITRFRTHSTPVILGAGERGELATEKYIPLTPVLEGIVILRENPDYQGDH